jgi:hypothetical protein
MMYRIVPILLLVIILSGCSILRPGKTPSTGTPGITVEPPRPTDTGMRPYRRIITAEAVSDTGLFIAHRIKDKLYYEIPIGELGKELLVVSRIAMAQAGMGHGGQRVNNQVVRWVRVGDRILLRNVSYQIMADSSKAIYQAVRAANFEPIIASFNIEAINRDSSTVVIDVTRLYTTDVPEFAMRQRFRARRVDADRSYIDRVAAFPDNIEVRNVLTMDADTAPGDLNLRTVSVMYNHSMVRLPENPMKPRLFDERIGFYSVSQIDFGRDTHRAEQRRFITRWRLEKKDSTAALSDPVKPITFYVDRATPEQWVPWVINGIEEWQTAFEKAGFSNAIIGKIPPSLEDDPDWSPEDARYPTIRWVPSTVENAMGPHVHDPRTGEILTSSIQMYHNVMNLLRNWYFTQGAAVDERAQTVQFPDSLMGRLIQYVVAHEVGHTLGFPHNMKASATVPTDSLRSPTFTHRYGTTPSIMDYARMNYVAQPGDGAYMFPKVSVYDDFAIEWGYTPIPESSDPDGERLFLEEIVRRQETNPMLLFGHLSPIDPTQQREALGDNHVLSTRYGIENIKRIMSFLLDAAGQDGETYEVLDELYTQVINHRNRMLGHVAAWIGGVYGERKVYGQAGGVYSPVSRERQVEAVRYLTEEGFATPAYLLVPSILQRIEPTGSVDRIMVGQYMLLSSLLDETRLRRMVDIEAMNGNPREVYRLEELLDDIRKGIWNELGRNPVGIDVYRRNLQRSHVRIIGGYLDPDRRAFPGEVRAYLRGSLRDVQRDIDRALPRTANRATRLHLEDLREEIRRVLEPR